MRAALPRRATRAARLLRAVHPARHSRPGRARATLRPVRARPHPPRRVRTRAAARRARWASAREPWTLHAGGAGIHERCTQTAESGADPALDRPFGLAEQGCDLAIGVTAEVRELDRGALALAQRRQGIAHGLGEHEV